MKSIYRRILEGHPDFQEDHVTYARGDEYVIYKWVQDHGIQGSFVLVMPWDQITVWLIPNVHERMLMQIRWP